MTDTPHLDLPVIDVLAQKHIIANDAFAILDALVMLAVLDRDLTAPPGLPAEGDRYLVKATGTGLFAGHDGKIAHFTAGDWSFYTPQPGWICFVADEALLLTWNGTAWAGFTSVLGDLQNLALLGVGTTANSTNPFSAKLNNVLWTAKTVAEGGDGDLRYKLNKESSSDTLSLLFQDNYSGRAEIGLTGDDDLHFKVSADGATWQNGLVIARSSGDVSHASSTDATSCTAAAATFAGGVGIAKRLYVGTRLSVNVASPLTSLHLDAAGLQLGASATASDNFYLTADAGNGLRWWNGNSGSGTLRLGLTSIGELKVPATTSASSTTTGALQVSGGVGIAGRLYVGNLTVFSSEVLHNTSSSTPGSGNTVGGFSVQPYGSDGSSVFISRKTEAGLTVGRNNDGAVVNFRRNDTAIGNIAVTASAVSYNTTSDARLKPDFRKVDGAGDIIDRLVVGRHNWLSDPDRWSLGVRAQDAAAVVPDAVSRGDDDNAAPDEPGFRAWGVDYSKFVPALIAEAQSLRRRVAALEAAATIQQTQPRG